MDQIMQYIPMIILYLPTAILGLLAVYGFLRGLMRGMKRSIVALVNMLIAVGVCILIPKMVSADFILTNVNKYFDTGIETLSVFIEDFFVSAGLVVTDVTINAVSVYVEIVVNLVLFIVCLLVVYYIVKFILYIFYLIFFRRRIAEYNEDNGKKALIGGVIGLVRGTILGFLVFSQFSTLYCVLAGGVFYEADEYNSIVVGEETWEYDEIYKALKTSRDFGLSSFLDGLAGEDGTPLDYLLMDYVLSGSYEDLNGNTVSLNLREELTGFTGVVAILIDNGVISFTSDFNFVYNIDKITDEVINDICNSIGSMNTLTDVIPTILVDILNENTDFYIDPSYLEDLDLENDFKEIANIFVQMLNIIDFGAEDMFGDIDWFDLDPAIVDSIITSLSKVTLLTKFALPIGVDFAVDYLNTNVDFLNDVVFNLDSILWDEEIQNLTGLYGLIVQLDWDVLMGEELDIFNDVLGNEELLEVVDSIIQQVLNSDVIFEITRTALSYFVVESLGSYDMGDLNINFDDFTKAQLKEDFSIILSSIADGVSIYELFANGEFSTDSLFDIDVSVIRNIFLGYTNQENTVVKGILDLNILQCLDFDNLLSNVINSSLDGVVSLPHISNWKVEFGYLFDVVEAVQTSGIDITAILEGDYSSISLMTEESQNTIIDSFVSSTIFSTLLVDTFSSLEVLDVPEGIEWYGEDGELHALLTAVFHLVNLDLIDVLLNDGDIFEVLSNLETNDFDVLLSSVILHSTTSSLLLDVANETDMLVIPTEALDSNGYIDVNEIINLIDVVLNLGLDFNDLDFTNVELLSSENIDGINNSIILSRSIVNLLDSSLDSFDIPDIGADWYNEKQELSKLLYAFQSILGADATLSSFDNFTFEISTILDNSDDIFNSTIVNILVSDVLLNIELIEVPSGAIDEVYNKVIILEDDLIDLCNSIKLLGIDDLENFDLSSLFSESLDYNKLLDSYILQATISTYLEDFDLLNIPNGLKEKDGYVSKVELFNLLTAIKTIGVSDLDSTEAFDLNNIMTNAEEVLESNILWVTISDMLLSIESIVIVDTVIKEEYEINVIEKEELKALFAVLADIEMDDFANIDFEMLIKLDAQEMFKSKILAAITSDSIVDSNALLIPSTVINDGYIESTELIKLFDGIKALGIDSMEEFSDTTFNYATLLAGDFNTVLASDILRFNISNEILTSDLEIVFEYDEEQVVFDLSNEEYILSSDEIINVLYSLEILASDYNEVSISISLLSNLTAEEIDVLLNSYIMCVALSQLINDVSAVYPAPEDSFTAELFSNGSDVTLYSQDSISTWITRLSSLQG